ncbi:hypothetical protein CABS01_13425 [Colletotrichum abscissum]|uniref:Uncharacterized protein n=1 Tax=Colletotrichum cuscutae TaxID=1209917 RepID=A0AAJ0DNE4_9PEZI|nr:uncharacterized protein CABS01_13425 [Colletotrichum abscissum]KAI3549795.1 hypothetical protein CSPX01_01969 [Colletotrichum filicis]KAK1485732.1 hypothetical protein CABS01_13425 [Colletotrichum abscissum]KAK1494081.1 hypothetical protein CCUS01_13748 [Colletotrichum cuscutae]
MARTSYHLANHYTSPPEGCLDLGPLATSFRFFRVLGTVSFAFLSPPYSRRFNLQLRLCSHF